MKQMKNAALKVAAKKEVKVINESPRYNLRLINKLVKGGVIEGIEGVTIAALKEQSNRLREIFDCEGYWWDSVVTDGRGGLVLSMRPLKLGEIVDESRVIRYRGMSYVARIARWSPANIVTSAALRIKQAEDIAKAFGTPYAWQIVKKSKSAMPSKTVKALKDINQRLKAGKITKAVAAAEIEKIIAA